MAGALEALLGNIFNRGVPVELGGGVDYVDGGAAFDEASGRVQVRQPTIGGTVTISEALTEIAVVFDQPYSAEDYQVHATPDSSTGTPATGSNRVLKTSAKSSAGFTLHTEVAPGAGDTVTFNWSVYQGSDA